MPPRNLFRMHRAGLFSGPSTPMHLLPRQHSSGLLLAVNQLVLKLPMRALARNTDPATSKHAASRLQATTIAERVLESLRIYGPADTDELAVRLGLKLVTISPRMRPLARVGLVRAGAERNGKIVWEAT